MKLPVVLVIGSLALNAALLACLLFSRAGQSSSPSRLVGREDGSPTSRALTRGGSAGLSPASWSTLPASALQTASPIASQLQSRWSGFQPTDAEYRAVLAVHKAFDERYPATSSSDRAARLHEFSEMPEFQQQLRDALGDARFADWKMAGQAHFRSLDILAPELGMAPATVKEVATLSAISSRCSRPRNAPSSNATRPTPRTASGSTPNTSRRPRRSSCGFLSWRRHIAKQRTLMGPWFQAAAH